MQISHFFQTLSNSPVVEHDFKLRWTFIKFLFVHQANIKIESICISIIQFFCLGLEEKWKFVSLIALTLLAFMLW